MKNNIFKFIIFLLISNMLFGCSAYTQTSSGQAYVNRQNAQMQRKSPQTSLSSFQEEILKIASVEPTLEFPAKIGLARLQHSHLTAIPAEEAEAWENLKTKLGSEFGEFVPINPMVAEMVSEGVSFTGNNATQTAINKIRLGAARQHVDAVLIYEVVSISGSSKNFLSIADLTIIGAYILPSQTKNAEAIASALLIDVVQGYPYGTVTANVIKANSTSTSVGSYNKGKMVSKTAETKAAINLTGEVEKLMHSVKLNSESNYKKS